MAKKVDFSKLRTPWTKYDAVQVIEVVYSIEALNKFKNKEASINEAILRSFLGINSLHDELPKYWLEIQQYPNEKKLFALFAALFMHGGIINEFAEKYATGDMKGLFTVEAGKQYTNIRSALIESGAAPPIYRKTKTVPYDFSPLFQKPEIGKLFKQVLLERISRLTKTQLTDDGFYEICFANHFHKAISLSQEQFKNWLGGIAAVTRSVENSFIKTVSIANFFCVEDVQLDFNAAKEIYFLGENGDGKSLILMGIYLAFNGNYIIGKTNQEETGKAADIIRNNKGMLLFGCDDKGQEYHPQKDLYLNNLFGYGTHRGRYSTDKPEQYGFMSLFDSEQTLLNPVSWLKDQKLLELNLQAGTESKKPENTFSEEYLVNMLCDILEKHLKIQIEGNKVVFIEKGSDLTFDQLSEGYRSVLIFVADLIYRLNKNAHEGEQVSDLKGIVLVDEIDLHLHPKWQRVIVRKLRKLLPNVQFIFTTHSPTIIQGASEDAIIYRVYRHADDGKTRVSDPYYRKDLDHLMMNTVVTSPLFGLADSRMNPNDDAADTSSTYLLYRINKKVEAELEKQKERGKVFLDDSDIDDLIQQILDEELAKNDKN